MMNYRGLPLTAEPVGGVYVPVVVHSWSFPQDQLVDQTMCFEPAPANVANGYASVDGGRFPVLEEHRAIPPLRTPTKATVGVNSQLRLNVAAGGDGVLVATSSDTSVATVSVVSGVVTVHGVGVGTCTVTVQLPGTETFRSRAAVVPVTVVAAVRSLTSDAYGMSALYPETYQSMTSIPDVLETSAPSNVFCMFGGCSSLKSLDLSSFDVSNVTVMTGMFTGCSSLKSLDLSSFDTSSVTRTNIMFQNCSSLTSLDLTSFDTSSVTVMAGMFIGCSSLTSLDLSSFDTSSVTTIDVMFGNCTSLMSVAGVFDLSSMPVDTSKLQDMFAGTQVTEVTFKNVPAALAPQITTSLLGMAGGSTITILNTI